MPRTSTDRTDHRIKPYTANPRYWQYKGKPTLLLGGSVDDNLFQIPDLAAHLDLLQSVGGNYIRNTMSDRPDQGYEIKAFGRQADGQYNLDTWNEAYWQRFAALLEGTAARDIIVQIEIWDRFDHSQVPWLEDPFNPKNNINYSTAETGLDPEYPKHPGSNSQPFFYTVPALKHNPTVLAYQQKFVDKILSFTLAYDHILYCMDNETSGAPEWGLYWSTYINKKAQAAGVQIETTEMWDNWDVRNPTHRPTLDHPDQYAFVDLSQNSHNTGQTNWDRAQWVREYIAAHPRPINSTKIYGADTSKWTDRGINSRHAPETFWRNLIGGFASSRFHRPPSGLGLSAAAQAHIRSGRMLADAFNFFNATPDATHQALHKRQENSAYLSYLSGRQYAVYFPDGGAVELAVEGNPNEYELRWLEIEQSRWHTAQPLSDSATATLAAPGAGCWVALVTRQVISP